MKKYFAELEFEDAFADATSNNLRKLKQRIKNNFAGEMTDWGYKTRKPLTGYAIYRHGKLIEKNK